MDNYRMLAEHFGRNGKVRVIVAGDEAKTDGTTIYLPENVPERIRNVLLATLLHESYHIRLTDFQAASKMGDAHRGHLLNVLEDVRIDDQVFTDWPNARNLYAEMIEYYTETHGADFDKLNWQTKVLRNFILRAYAMPHLFASAMHSDAEVAAFEAKHGAALDVIEAKAKAAPDTKTLAPLVDEMLALLFPHDPKDEAKRQKAMQNIKQAGPQAKAARDAQRAAQKDAQDLVKEVQEDENEAHDAERENVKEGAKEKAAKAKAEKKRAEAKAARKAGDNAKADEADAEADKAEAEAAEAKEKAKKAAQKAAEKAAKRDAGQEKLDKLGKEFKKQEKAGDEAQKKIDANAKDLKEVREKNAADEAKALGDLAGVGVGFDKIKGDDLKVQELIPQNVEDEVLDFLRERETRNINAPEGTINPARLPQYFDVDNLFARDMNDAHYKTRVHFLVDISGSMGSRLYDENLELNGKRLSKSDAATQAVMNICRAIEKGINGEGLDIEYGIFGFDEAAHEIKGFDKPLVDQDVADGLKPRGGTDPRAVILDVENKHQPDCIRTKQVVFMITDGQFDQDAYDVLEKQTVGNIKWVCLGIEACEDDAKSLEVFGRYNIRKLGDLKKYLGRALIENVE